MADLAATDHRITRSDGVAHWRGRPLPPGPWHSETDSEEFVHASGLPCRLQRGPMGAWCGYVGVPGGHPWHGVDYDSIDATVHGGLTWSEMEAPGLPADTTWEVDGVHQVLWWVGFDCNHSGDLSLYDLAGTWGVRQYGTYKTLSYVKSQTMDLAAQVAAASEVR